MWNACQPVRKAGAEFSKIRYALTTLTGFLERISGILPNKSHRNQASDPPWVAVQITRATPVCYAVHGDGVGPARGIRSSVKRFSGEFLPRKAYGIPSLWRRNTVAKRMFRVVIECFWAYLSKLCVKQAFRQGNCTTRIADVISPILRVYKGGEVN